MRPRDTHALARGSALALRDVPHRWELCGEPADGCVRPAPRSEKSAGPAGGDKSLCKFAASHHDVAETLFVQNTSLEVHC